MLPFLLTLALLVAEAPARLEQEMSRLQAHAVTMEARLDTLQAQLATMDARLDALREAVAKAEVVHGRQGERLYELVQENTRLQTDRLGVLKERLDRSEGESSGISQGWGVLMGLIGIGVAVAALLNARRKAAWPPGGGHA